MVDYIRRRHVAEVKQVKEDITSLPEYIAIQEELDSLKEDRDALDCQYEMVVQSIKKITEEYARINKDFHDDPDYLFLSDDAEAIQSKIGILNGIRSGLIKRLRGLIIIHLDGLAAKDWDFSLASKKNISLFNKEFFGFSVHKEKLSHLVNLDIGNRATAFTFSSAAIDRGNVGGQNRKLVIVADNEKVRYLGYDENEKPIVKIHKARYPHGTLRVKRKTAEIMWNVWQDLCSFSADRRNGWRFPLILVEGQFQIISKEHLKYDYLIYNRKTGAIYKQKYSDYCSKNKNKFNLTEEQYNDLPYVSVQRERDIIAEKLEQEFIQNLTEEEYNSWKAKQEKRMKISKGMKASYRKRREQEEEEEQEAA